MRVWALYQGRPGDMRLMGLYESREDGQAEVDALMEEQRRQTHPKGCSLIQTEIIPAKRVEAERSPDSSAPACTCGYDADPRPSGFHRYECPKGRR